MNKGGRGARGPAFILQRATVVGIRAGSAAVEMWEHAHAAHQLKPPTPNALACRRRHDDLRAAGLCIFCGRHPATSLCGECRRRQSEQGRERYRRAVEAEGRTVRPYRRKD